MDKKYLVYVIQNKANGLKYVGATSQTFKKRWSQHLRASRAGSESYIHRAIKKSGKESFFCESVTFCLSSEDMYKKEIELISKIGTVAPNGYNLNIGGLGIVPTMDSRKKQSVCAKKYHSDPIFKERHRAAVKKSRGTDEQRAITSRIHKGKVMHPNAKAAIMAAKKTDEYKAIASNAAKKTWEKEGFKDFWKKSKLENHINNAKRFPMREDGMIFSSTRSAADFMVSQGFKKAASNNICLACNGKYKSSYGYSWSWVCGDKARVSGEKIL